MSGQAPPKNPNFDFHPMDSEAKQRDPPVISSCATSLRCDFPTVVFLFGTGGQGEPLEFPPGVCGPGLGSWGGTDGPNNPNPGQAKPWGLGL